MENNDFSTWFSSEREFVVPRLTSLQRSARARISAAMSPARLPNAFAGCVLDALADAVGCDDSRFFTLDPSSRLLNRVLAATASDAPFRSRWLAQIYLSELDAAPYFAPQVLIDHAISAVTYRPDQSACFGLTDELRARVQPDTHVRVFHDTLTPKGGSLRLLLRDTDAWIGMIDLVRRDGTRPFDERDYAFTRQAIPLIARGLAQSLRFERAHRSPPDPSKDAASGAIVLSEGLSVRYASPSAETWIALLRQTEGGCRNGLPTAILAATAYHRERACAGSVTVRTPMGEAMIEASSGGDDGSTLVVVSAVRPPALPSVPHEWPLSPAERRVVQLLISGRRNREIAQCLAIAETTVETHLAHVYEKLGARGRGDVLSKLFTDSLLDTM